MCLNVPLKTPSLRQYLIIFIRVHFAVYYAMKNLTTSRIVLMVHMVKGRQYIVIVEFCACAICMTGAWPCKLHLIQRFVQRLFTLTSAAIHYVDKRAIISDHILY